MPRPLNPGWKPITMKLSEDVIEALRDAAHERNTYMGRIANEILQPALGIDSKEDCCELFQRCDAAIKTHWVTVGKFQKALTALSGERFPPSVYWKWQKFGNIPPAVQPWIRTLLNVVDNLPQAAKP